ncbi:MAG: type I-B CRISPR-associated protein Cas7/Csh2 [Patescibacteria group bacterium]|uniref:type I CRISPR-associated protein Cas7 n=1 Tax=Thermonema sp. TaxID=2231181 RepID=UPI0021DBB683|nr:type I CRISPR-associated protein Cas7 [Thermonema sp.]GIV39348.1 MAG: type I-B CRISPR-associated protein Cas7/Csh2 [Thermonema sp.]GIW61081.1 MAG: type I-B CRISPR-associated protein Cas7/Csh2 [Patescibacteria group bacterium]
MENIIKEKSEILFLYEVKYSIPNGDPFTGEQRYDEDSKKILVSDVRIKRFIRDYLQEAGNFEIYVTDKEKSLLDSKESGSASRLNALIEKHKTKHNISNPKKITEEQLLKVMQECIDVRLFGGISTKEKAAVNLTGPVQFALLNPSLNRVDLRIHQNTSLFSSSGEKSRGAIGTTSIVPYAVCQIHGWVTPFAARYTSLTPDDLDTMFTALWESVNNSNTRSKSGQDSLLLLQFVYQKPTDKVYGIDRALYLEPAGGVSEEQVRSFEEAGLKVDRLKEIINSPKIKEVRYYTEHPAVEAALTELLSDKLKKMQLKPVYQTA